MTADPELIRSLYPGDWVVWMNDGTPTLYNGVVQIRKVNTLKNVTYIYYPNGTEGQLNTDFIKAKVPSPLPED